MAEQVSMFSLVVGIALLLTGIGFIIIAASGAIRRMAVAGPEPRAAEAPSTG